MSKKILFSVFLFSTVVLLFFGMKIREKTLLFNIKEGKMKLTSVFEHGSKIPSVYTCDGDDIPPQLIISEVPEGTKSLALIVDDPDAPVGLFVHWVLYNIPANTKIISSEEIPQGAIEGMTNFGRTGYGGPCPPSGSHRYFFKLYAVDKMLDLPKGATKNQVENAIKDHVIEKAELMGVYSRK